MCMGRDASAFVEDARQSSNVTTRRLDPSLLWLVTDMLTLVAHICYDDHMSLEYAS